MTDGREGKNASSSPSRGGGLEPPTVRNVVILSKRTKEGGAGGGRSTGEPSGLDLGFATVARHCTLPRLSRPPPPPPPICEGGRQTWVRAVGDEQSLLNPDPGMGLVFTY
jgi:hypothetical protein